MSSFNHSAPPSPEKALLPPAYVRAQRAATFSSPDFKSIILELQVEQNDLRKDTENSTRLRNLGAFFLLFVFIMVIFTNHIEHPRAAYQFSVRWPAADCATNSTACDIQLASKYTWFIARFVPLTPNRSCKTYCSDRPFNESEVASLKPDLTKSWPNTAKFETEANKSIWAYEWQKYGTCTDLGQFNYFARALSLYSCHTFSQWLSDAGIFPSNFNSYTTQQVKEALASRLWPKTSFTLHCVWYRGLQFLSEISLCVAEDGRQLTECPEKKVVSDTCRDEFFYAATFWFIKMKNSSRYS